MIGWRIAELQFFGHRLRLQKQSQVIAPDGLGILDRHVEIAERMRVHQRAGAFSVETEKKRVCLTASFLVSRISALSKSVVESRTNLRFIDIG